MVSRVFFHIGLQKTGTSFLQSILWSNREELRRQGMLLPGVERRDHLWASCVVREDPHVGRRNRLAESSWARLREEISRWPGDAVISHEFFSSASGKQAGAAIDDLAPAEVHVVVTARDTLDLFVSGWQEAIKNKQTVALGRFCASASENPLVVWDWRALDLSRVLERWSTQVPGEHVHVIPLTRAPTDQDELWYRFATVLGVAPDGIDSSGGFRNPSLGVVEIETLRRINARLEGFNSAFDRGIWVRTYLADERLAPRGGERFWPSPAQIADCRDRGARAVQFTRERHFDVVGRLDDLLTPDDLPARRHPDSVTDSEVAAVAVDLVATLLSDVRRLRNIQRAPTHNQAEVPKNRLIRDLLRRFPLLERLAREKRKVLTPLHVSDSPDSPRE